VRTTTIAPIVDKNNNNDRVPAGQPTPVAALAHVVQEALQDVGGQEHDEVVHQLEHARPHKHGAVRAPHRAPDHALRGFQHMGTGTC